MKYGDTLRQRSIPEWAHYNIDYDYLKDLIKEQTTPGTGKALSIPGQGDTIEKAFGGTFYNVLKEQHARINCFVTSKSGEIESRLDYISKRLSQLHAKRQRGGPLPARTVEQYAKIDADVTRAGEEIRSLARFRTAQRTGFYKILKKYKRWTKDSELEQRFNRDISSDPDSFFQLDLGYLLDQYIDVLGAVRAPLSTSDSSTPSTKLAPTSASRLSKSIEAGTELDFDITLSTTPLGSQGGTATYWVPIDHLVEVQVFLLQHMRLYTGTSKDSLNGSPIATPARCKSSATIDKYLVNEDDVGMIVLDRLDSFVPRQNGSTVGASEEAVGRTRAQASGHVYWAGTADAAVIVQATEGPEGMKVAKLKRKFVEAFLDTTATEEADAILREAQNNDEQRESFASVRQWLTKYSQVQPIAGVCSKRTRFLGLHNNSIGGVWATLDRDISMSDSLIHYLRDLESLSEGINKAIHFPHAVLEVRREGTHSAALIQQLDGSHLVQRVHGYSLETHAVWACSQPDTMTPPVWSPLLNQDIRKLPSPAKKRRRKASSRTASQLDTSPPQTSTSTTSVTDGQSSPFMSRHEETPATSASELIEPPSLQAFRKKRKHIYAGDALPVQYEEPPQKQGYWNEYDNPESEDEGYYIYIDPNASVSFPGQEILESWARKTKQFFLKSKKAGEQSPLLSTAEYVSSDEETADESSNVYGTMSAGRRGQRSEGYFSSLFNSMRNPQRDARTLDTMQRQSELQRQSLLSEINVQQRQREMAKLQTYCSCLAAGAVLDIVLVVLATTSRRKLRGEVDVAVILGVICNLLLLLTAVVSMETRHDRLNWLHQGSVYIFVIGMVVGDVLLFRWALNM